MYSLCFVAMVYYAIHIPHLSTGAPAENTDTDISPDHQGSLAIGSKCTDSNRQTVISSNGIVMYIHVRT